MTSGILFYWFSWMLWVIVTFFMKKSIRRTFYACWILCMLMFSNLSIEIGVYRVGVSFVVLLIGLISFHAMAKSLYLIFSGFTVSLCYIAILFWEHITPVWLFLPRSILIPLMITFIIFILTNNFQAKLAIGLLGITSGEIFHSYILSSYKLEETVGGLAFFDIIFMVVIVVVFLETIQKGRIKLYSYVQTYKQSLGWKVNQS